MFYLGDQGVFVGDRCYLSAELSKSLSLAAASDNRCAFYGAHRSSNRERQNSEIRPTTHKNATRPPRATHHTPTHPSHAKWGTALCPTFQFAHNYHFASKSGFNPVAAGGKNTIFLNKFAGIFTLLQST